MHCTCWHCSPRDRVAKHRNRREQIAREDAAREVEVVQDALDDIAKSRRIGWYVMSIDEYLDFISGASQFDFDAP